ncbi:transmembrane protein 117-like isoform X2 [Mercenaria mercenaria]|nr:transmembrane protein 117-like isoform X2 [Mercenaria mercenaria]XP_053384335.1 transmembrane protein 117-like isoform X2 [Mercenaria mercenaria]
MDPNSPRYEIVKDMEETENAEEKLDPLTEAKNSKNRNEGETERLTSNLIEDEDKVIDNSDTKVDENVGTSLIVSSENSAGAANNNDDDEKAENNNQTKDDNDKSKDELNKESESDKTEEKKRDDDIVVLVAGKDDVDAASTYSLFMEKDFRYYFQHPYCRLFIAYFVVFCNFLIYAEDPVAHSRKECLIPMIGNDFAFVCTRYPANAWSLLKVVFWLTGLIVGLFIGKLLVHGLLFNKLFRLKMFSDSQGSWMVMFLISLITIFIMSLFYNLFLMIGGEAMEPYRISDLMGIRNDIFMKAAACGTWCGDFFTAWMVTDIMLQEKLYPGWARPVRTWWKRGWNRIILFWIVVAITSFVVIFVIATDYIQWDKLNRDFLPTNEVSRAFLASFILVMDFLIVMQDWDFPHFMSAIDIKLPGLNMAHIRFSIPKFLKKDKWQVHITGKWFNYGILFLVMLLDMNMWKNQIFYQPYDYGQYTNPDGRIYTVQDDFSLENHNETQITYSFRNSTINNKTGKPYIDGDTHMNTKYLDISIGIKGIAFVPSIAAFIVFGVLIWNFGRFKPTEHDPYAGRLKKRLKKRLSFKNLSFRLPWRRREEVRRKIHAVPKLLYFKRKGTKGEKEQIEQKEIPAEGFIDDSEAKIEEKTEPTVVENTDKKIEEKVEESTK